MTIETSLIRLTEAVLQGQILSAEDTVLLPTGDEAQIYGFIAIHDSFLSLAINMPPLGECHVLSNRVICFFDKQLYRFPIFSSVGKVSEQRYPLYLLYMERFLELPAPLNSYYTNYLYRKANPRYLSKIDGVQVENDIAYYLPNENDLYFESRSKLQAIGTGFLVVTRRLAKISDNIKYEVFDAFSVMTERI